MRTVLSIVAGFLLWSVLWVGGNATLAQALPDHFDENGVTRSAGVLLLILGFSVVVSVLSGLLTAAIGKKEARRCGVILGVVLLAVGILVQTQFWSLMPIWYHLVFLALLLPATVVGSRLRSQVA